MKKKILYCGIGIIVIILAIFFLCQYDNEEKVVLMDKHVPRKIETSAISMMYETETGSGIYEATTDSSFSPSGYKFNATLSKCEKGSALSYDEETGKVMMQTNKSDRCYVYFDALPPKYWNDGFSGTTYAFPNTPATTYTSPTQLSSQYYIKTTATEYQACLYYNNNEFCLKANYWADETEDTDGSITMTKLQTQMASALGVDTGELICYSDSNHDYCNVSDSYCRADSNGSVYCYGDGSICVVSSAGYAYCNK